MLSPLRQLELIWSLSTAARPIRRHSRDGREIQIFDGNTDVWQKYWQSQRKYRFSTEILTKLKVIQIFDRNTDKVNGNINFQQKYWQSWRKYRCLTEILTKKTEIQIFNRITEKVDGNTDIWQKYWQSWRKYKYLQIYWKRLTYRYLPETLTILMEM